MHDTITIIGQGQEAWRSAIEYIIHEASSLRYVLFYFSAVFLESTLYQGRVLVRKQNFGTDMCDEYYTQIYLGVEFVRSQLDKYL